MIRWAQNDDDFGLDLFFPGVFLLKYSVLFCWLLAVKLYQKKTMLQISAFGPLVFLQCFFFEAIGFGTSWCKMTKNVENQHDVVSMVPNLGGEWSWFQHVNKTDLNILAKTMQDAKGENHVTIVMILPTFSTLRHLWCSHHSAFVKSLPIFFFIAAFKSGSQRAGIDSMYFLAFAPHGLACCDVFPAPFWLVV